MSKATPDAGKRKRQPPRYPCNQLSYSKDTLFRINDWKKYGEGGRAGKEHTNARLQLELLQHEEHRPCPYSLIFFFFFAKGKT